MAFKENKMIQITKDQSFRVVCNLRTPLSADTTTVGTGVFVSKDNKAYLVTASHVAKATSVNTEIVLCDANNNPTTCLLTQLNKSLAWINHPVEDISALEIDIANNLSLLTNRCFPFYQIEINYGSFSRDKELTCVGFPKGLGVTGKFSPFTFRSYISCPEITLLRSDTKTPAIFGCLENPSVGGYSGGPIFDLGAMVVGIMVSSSGPTKLLGIMHGTLFDDTGGKIAVFSPAAFLKDII